MTEVAMIEEVDRMNETFRWLLTWMRTFRGGELSLAELKRMSAKKLRNDIEPALQYLVVFGYVEKNISRPPPPSRPRTVYRLTEKGATVDVYEEFDDGAVTKKPDGTAGSWVDTSKAFKKGSAGEAERRVGADRAPEEGREGGFAGEAEPGAVARRGAGEDARGEDGGQACPHCDAPRIEVTVTVRWR